ncbi:class II aldolase/adducin family protein [Victivallis sp. Marseille-Q1083]|uniref:class II aldolase/adducin family protein n=1 Tax=Victivallis sp. Marseille-Q1083 TaxID=2717288 RepID=UPI00158B6E69|nr:class II aldolase/adducin family protein [Victivallis sp. Marseille-Q1083]
MKLSKFSHPRDQIVTFMQRLYDYGLTTTSGGNLSILDDNGDMWISPSSVDKGALRREDIMCVKADGSIEGMHRPSVEYPFHRAIYRIRPDVKAILHAHPPMLVAYSLAGVIPDTAILPNLRTTCGEVGFAGYAVPGSEELGKKLAAEFQRGCDTILLENHGACTAGLTLLEAFQRFETLDFGARILNNGSQIGTPRQLSKAQVEVAMLDRNCNFREFTPVSHCSRELELRRQLAMLVRRAYDQTLFNSTTGTFAARLDDKRFLITPHHCDRAAVEPEDFVLVDGDCYEAGKLLSRNAWFCRELFRLQPELNAVIFAQPPSIMAYGVTGIPFDAKTIPESYILLRDMPMLKFDARYQDAETVCRTLSPRDPVILIENDCLITTGKTPLEAFDRLEVADYSARAVLAARFVGSVRPINTAQVAEIVEAFKLIP